MGAGGNGCDEKEAERIAREDVLRLLSEEGGSASVEKVSAEIGDPELADRVLRSLEKEGLIGVESGVASLTGEGQRVASSILERHRSAEKLLARLANRLGVSPHQLAHCLEHLGLHGDVLARLASAEKITRLSDLKPGDVGRVIAVLEAKPRILARLYGVGVAPGRKLRVVARGPGFIVVETGVEARPAALDMSVAEKVLVELA